MPLLQLHLAIEFFALTIYRFGMQFVMTNLASRNHPRIPFLPWRATLKPQDGN